MRVFIAVIVLIFSLQSIAKADDISDFEMEGMSIGDSLLEFVTKKNIQSGKVNYYKSNKYTVIELFPNEFKKNISTYDIMQIQFLANDKKMRIAAISGIIYYKKNIKNCYEKLDTIYNEVVLVFSSWNDLGKETYEVHSDKVTDYVLENNSKDEIQIGCYDYSDDAKNTDHFRIVIRKSAYTVWLREQLYD